MVAQELDDEEKPKEKRRQHRWLMIIIIFFLLILPFLLGGIYPYPTCTCSHVPTLPTLGPALKKKMPDAWMSLLLVL